MVALDAAQAENLSTALVVARAWAVASGNDPTAVAERVAFVWWTESRGYIYANDGSNQSQSPGFDSHPEWPGILRRSLNIRHDKVGNNGRSTGGIQQISEDVGGGWGDMAGTMDPAISTARFLARLVITDNPVYAGTLLTSTGSRRVAVNLSSPVAADVLRIQQPLADEAESDNYDAAQVAIAREIVAQLSPSSPATGAGDFTLEWMVNPMSLTPDQQKQLGDYAKQVGGEVISVNINGHKVDDLLWHGPQQPNVVATGAQVAAVLAAVKAAPKPVLPATLKSQVDGKDYATANYLVSIDRKQSENAAAIGALSAKLDAILAAVTPKAAS